MSDLDECLELDGREPTEGVLAAPAVVGVGNARKWGRSAVVVGQVPHQALVGVWCRAGALVLLPQLLGRRDVRGIGDRLAARPDPVVSGDEPVFVADLDPGQSAWTSTNLPMTAGSTE